MKLYDFIQWSIVIAILFAIVALFLDYYDIAIVTLTIAIIAYGIF